MEMGHIEFLEGPCTDILEYQIRLLSCKFLYLLSVRVQKVTVILKIELKTSSDFIHCGFFSTKIR